MRYLFLSLAVVFTSAGTDAHSLSGKLRADGTEFVLSLSDGRTLRGADVIGMQLVVQHHSEAVSIRIEGVSEEAKAAGGAVFLYRASVHEPGGSSHDLCLPDAAGRRAGFPIPDEKGWFSFSCTSGVEAKCVLMGYRPWEQHPSGASMRDLHKTCIHLMRADYGGDDQPTTRDGTSIDVEDRFGIQTFGDVEGMTFEAAWGPDGALCVARPRIAGNITLEVLAKRYSRLARAVGPEACTRERMAGDARVLLFNRSYPD
jgi:hypothetical protein